MKSSLNDPNFLSISRKNTNIKSMPVVQKPLISYMQQIEDPSEIVRKNITTGFLRGLMGITSSSTKVKSSHKLSEQQVQQTYQAQQVKTTHQERTYYNQEVTKNRISLREKIDFSNIPQKVAKIAVMGALCAIIAPFYLLHLIYKAGKNLSNSISDAKYRHQINKQIKIEQKQIEQNMQIFSQEAQELKQTFEQYKSCFDNDEYMPNLKLLLPDCNYNLDNINHYSRSAKKEYLEKAIQTMQACKSTIQQLIENQRKIIEYKRNYKQNRKNISSNDINNIKNSKLNKIETKNEASVITEIKRLAHLFITNSKEIKSPLLCFRNIVNQFFKNTGKDLECIKMWDKEPALKGIKYAERIPKLGLIPKTIRIIDQINITRYILKDYKSVTKDAVENGINPLVSNYSEDFRKIKSFVLKNKANMSPNELLLANELLKKIQIVRNNNLEGHKKLLNRFVDGSLKIKNICRSIRIKNGIAFILKAAATFGTPA